MPYVRRELFEWMRQYGDVFYDEQYQLSDSAASAIIGRSLKPEVLLRCECERLIRGSMYYVDTELCELVRHAAPSMPEFSPNPYDLPSPFGFMWWNSPVIIRPNVEVETLTHAIRRICNIEDVGRTTMKQLADLIATIMIKYEMSQDEAVRECAIIAKQVGVKSNTIETRCSMEDLAASGAVEMLEYIGGPPTPVRAATWGPYGVEELKQSSPNARIVDGVVAGSVWVSFWTDPIQSDKFWPSFASKPPLMIENEILYPWYVDDYSFTVVKDIESVYSWFHALLATLQLSKQANLTESTTQRVDRAERKRAARVLSSRATDSVLVTRLRQSHSGSGARNGERKIGRDHRFPVEGHWRNVWQGSHTDPCRPRVQRPQWILPYVKGADGAPLVIRDRVVKM